MVEGKPGGEIDNFVILLGKENSQNSFMADEEGTAIYSYKNLAGESLSLNTILKQIKKIFFLPQSVSRKRITI